MGNLLSIATIDPHTPCAQLAMNLPTVELSGTGYYAICGVVFLFAGLISGFFIWRKGHLQTLDAEAEVRRTAEALERLRKDLVLEEASLGTESGDESPKPAA